MLPYKLCFETREDEYNSVLVRLLPGLHFLFEQRVSESLSVNFTPSNRDLHSNLRSKLGEVVISSVCVHTPAFYILANVMLSYGLFYLKGRKFVGSRPLERSRKLIRWT